LRQKLEFRQADVEKRIFPSILIVHRIMAVENVDGTLYFQTKGDGNGNLWPQTPTTASDKWDSNSPPGVPANLVVGKVVMHIPWSGWVTLFIKNNQWGLHVVITIIMLLIIVEFVVPEMHKKRPEQQKQT
jgi:hypothetical protein